MQVLNKIKMKTISGIGNGWFLAHRYLALEMASGLSAAYKSRLCYQFENGNVVSEGLLSVGRMA